MDVLELLFPPRCLFCGKVSENGQTLCRRCAESLRRQPNPLREQRFLRENIVWAVSPFHYEGGVRSGIAAFKFHGDLRGARFFGEEMAQTIRDCGLDKNIDCVTFVPMTEERRNRRGYNQAELLAEVVAKELALELKPDVLRRIGLFPQHQLAAEFRAKSAESSFALCDGADLSGRRVLLADDIFTTGETARRCAQLLQNAGAISVAAAAAAH